MRNIGIVCYPTFGGSGIVASELGKALSSKYEVHFIAYEKPVRFDNSQPNMFYHKVDVPTYPLFEYPPYELALTTTIVEIVERFKLDLIHVHYAIPHAYAAINARQILIKRGINLPIITTLHGTDITLIGKSPSVVSAVNYAINESSCVTAVSESLRLDTLRYFNIKKNIQVIPNFICFNSTSFPSRKNDTKILTHISNFRPVKRVLDVIKIFDNIQHEIDSKLIMIGDGPDLDDARRLVTLKGLTEKVSFLGKSNRIEEVLKLTDLFLLPSESESFGLVALEAMSFGVPVLTTASGGITELVLDKKNGYVCKVADIQDMSAKSIKLLSDITALKEMSLNAYETAKLYDVNKILPMYEDCYMNLIN